MEKKHRQNHKGVDASNHSFCANLPMSTSLLSTNVLETPTPLPTVDEGIGMNINLGLIPKIRADKFKIINEPNLIKL